MKEVRAKTGSNICFGGQQRAAQVLLSVGAAKTKDLRYAREVCKFRRHN